MAPSTARITRAERPAGRPTPQVIAALIAAVAFITEGVVALVHATGDQHWDLPSQVLNVAFACGCLALAVALPAVGGLLDAGRVGRVGVAASQVGLLAMTVESVASSIHDGNVLGGVFFAGLILTLVGQLVLAIGGARSRDRRWLAPLPFLGMLISIVGGDHGGSIVLGVVWAGFALRGASRRASRGNFAEREAPASSVHLSVADHKG